MPIPLLIPLAVGAAGAVGKMFGRGRANKMMDRLANQNPAYKVNPLSEERLALARTLLNARMPGAASVEKNIFTNAANQVYNINRNVSDSSQALQLAAGVQGQQNEAFNRLGIDEAQDYQRRFGNYVGANEAMIGEQDKVFNDELRRYQDRVNFEQAKNENRQNTWGDLSNLGFSMLNFGAAGGFDNMFNRIKNTNLPSPMNTQASTIPISRPSFGGFNRSINTNSGFRPPQLYPKNYVEKRIGQ